MNIMEYDYSSLIKKECFTIYPNIFYSDECSEICEMQIDNDIINIEPNPVTNPRIPKQNFETFTIENQPHLEEKIIKYIFDCNIRNYGYEIWGLETDITLLTFQQGCEYGYHSRLDFFSNEACDRKLTGYVFLSPRQKYEGGQFLVDPLYGITLPQYYNEQGNLLIYPSFVTIKINPISQGAMQVLTFDIVGPKLK